jgi:hypothetical protein
MNKIDLLAQLPPYPTNPVALALAKLALTDEQVAKLNASLYVRMKRLVWVGRFQATLLLGLVLFSVATALDADTVAHRWPAFLAGVAALFGSSFVDWYLSRPLSMLPQLVPLKETSLCEEALELVSTGGPNVAAWRNIALAERNQLYSFDYNIMYLLASQYQSAQSKAARQEALDKACRALHEIPA